MDYHLINGTDIINWLHSHDITTQTFARFLKMKPHDLSLAIRNENVPAKVAIIVNLLMEKPITKQRAFARDIKEKFSQQRSPRA